ncbi:MAG TPA: hypothetical protein VK141_07265 [Nitrosomonas sp.]|nr:hypothetical protein [Bacteroidota bacterium]HLP81771.1 hypothetical protein [Nitrosomonas sp.]
MNNVKEIIAIYVDSIEKYHFFRRFHKPAIVCGHELVFFTNRLSVKCSGYRDSTEVHLLKSTRIACHPVSPINSREALDGSLSENEVKRLYEAVTETFEKVFTNKKITTIFIFGGRNTAELSMRRNAEKHAIKTLYFELANLPGKIFVDPQGTNADSSIHSNRSQLEYFQVDSKTWEAWIGDYLRSKSVQLAPPQSIKKRPIHLSYLLDYMGFHVLNIPYENNRSLIRTLRQKLWQRRFQYDSDTYNILKGGFIFFPMQVSNDAQLLFHSEIDNITAIRHCISEANRTGLDLVVKIHPAEEDPREYARVIELRKTHPFFIVDAPSIAIVQHCAKVITINSTVGLEAKLIGKPVDFLGRSVYREMNNKLLKNYIHSFLIDIDYFNYSPISIDSYRSLLMRAECPSSPYDPNQK